MAREDKGSADSRAAERKRTSDRKARLAEELRANLQRRKAQSRSRRQGAADARPEGLSTGEHKKD